MKALMKDNLIVRYQQCKELDYRAKNKISNEFNEMQSVKQYMGMEEYFKLKEFLKSIEGKIIELVFLRGDAFEKHDNNYWLPESLWNHTDGQNKN